MKMIVQSDQSDRCEFSWEPSLAKDTFHRNSSLLPRYGIPYPTALLEEICNRAEISGAGRLLDLGCGTGEIAIPLASRFHEVIAVDADSEMLSAAKQKSADQDIQNINWIQQRAEQHTANNNEYELLTIGAAFHWMDRPMITQNACDWLSPGQPLVILGYTSIWTGTADWHPIVRGVIQKWLGEKRRAGSGQFDDALDPHEVMLAKAGFEIEEIQHQINHIWSLDHLIEISIPSFLRCLPSLVTSDRHSKPTWNNCSTMKAVQNIKNK